MTGLGNDMGFRAIMMGGGATTNLLGHLLHRIATFILIACAAGLSIDPTILAYSAEKRSVPNVVLILADDQGYGDLGCHGNKVIKTPNLDRLYRECLRLTNYHVDPTGAPSRAASCAAGIRPRPRQYSH